MKLYYQYSGILFEGQDNYKSMVELKIQKVENYLNNKPLRVG